MLEHSKVNARAWSPSNGMLENSSHGCPLDGLVVVRAGTELSPLARKFFDWVLAEAEAGRSA